MKNLRIRYLRSGLSLLIPFFIMGCASKPVKLDLPVNHPAHPVAQEAEFLPPPNPFLKDMTQIKEEPEADATMKHKMPPKSSQQQPHMQHHMSPPKESPPGAASKQKPAHKQSDHMHQEQGQ